MLALITGRSPAIAVELLKAHARHLAMRGRWIRAAADFREAARPAPLDRETTAQQIATLLAAGDREGVRRVASDLIERYGEVTDRSTLVDVAWSLALAPGAVADGADVVRMAGSSVGENMPAQPQQRRALGAALYRAGRDEEAVRRMLEGLETGQPPEPREWPFLAMAHLRLGDRDEAHRWLDRLRQRPASDDPGSFWEELEIRLLRGKAEAVILRDPSSPADPFSVPAGSARRATSGVESRGGAPGP